MSQNKSSTVQKALNVLETVARSRSPISSIDVAKSTGYDKSTAYRLLSTLEDAGYINRDSEAKKYQLSYKIIELGRNLYADDQLYILVQEALQEIAQITGETVHYSVIENDRTVIVAKATGVQLLSVDFHIGDSAKLHCTSIGKALLAFQDKVTIEGVISAGLPKVAKNTITDPMLLRKELERIREAGYAFDDCELADDMRCVAVPLVMRGGIVRQGFSISGPISRFTDVKLEALKEPMLEISRRLSLKLGAPL